MKLRKINIITSICLTTIIFLSGCSFKNSSATSKTSASNATSNTSQSSKLKPIDVKEVTALMQKIQNEKGVSSINVSRNNDTVTADITLKNDADSKNAKQLADKYSKQIKDTYSCKKTNINIIQNGKKIVNITLD